MKSWLRTLLYFLAVILITACVTVGIMLRATQNDQVDEVVFTAKEYAEISDLLFLNEMIGRIENDSLTESPGREALLEAAAEGMVAALDDPYAVYYTPEEYEAYLANINGEYTGIGILVGQPEETGAVILDVYEETPAAQAGLLPGDIITAVDGAPVAPMQLQELSAAIDREVGEPVTLSILRGTEPSEINLTCAQLNLSRVSHALFKERTGYIRISMFSGNCVTEFKEALSDLTERGMRSLVIDLRNNPGGTLESAVEIADALLSSGTIVSLRGRLDAEGVIYESNARGISVPLAVIVNENSASASEILAAAVQHSGAGVVVGMTTFGKGVVQTTMQIQGNQAWLKLTTEAYYTPSGKNIDGVGITPDIEIALPDELSGLAIDEIEQEDDAQLWAALDHVRALAAEAQ
ncbi:MAG: S41 family peptidase [Clostridiales bacterium]|nr:S41 family peptidase [Clostridiales bacterium]